jgi:predicted RNA methylase
MVSYIYEHYFDWKYQIDTKTWVSHEDLIAENDLAKYSGHYQPNCALLVKKVLKRLQPPKHQTFVDLGSGKGRIMILAAEYGFQKVKGVELSTNLSAITESNVKSYKTKTGNVADISVFNKDATSFEFEATDSVLFMYNPFNGVIFEKVINNIKLSLERHPRQLTIIYMLPTEKEIIESTLEFSSIQHFTWNEHYTIYTTK